LSFALLTAKSDTPRSWAGHANSTRVGTTTKRQVWLRLQAETFTSQDVRSIIGCRYQRALCNPNQKAIPNRSCFASDFDYRILNGLSRQSSSSASRRLPNHLHVAQRGDVSPDCILIPRLQASAAADEIRIRIAVCIFIAQS